MPAPKAGALPLGDAPRTIPNIIDGDQPDNLERIRPVDVPRIFPLHVRSKGLDRSGIPKGVS